MKVGGEELGLVPTHQTGLNSQLLFQDDPLRFGCTAPPSRVGDPPVPKPREIASGFAEARYFPPQASEFRHNPYGGDHRPGTAATRDWTENDTSSGDGSDGNEEEDDDDDDDDEGFDGLVGESSRAPNEVANLNNNSNSSANSSGGVVKLSNGKTKLGPLFGCAREVAVAKDGNTGQIMSETRASCGEIHQQQGRMGNFENAVTVAEPDGELYYSQYLRGAEVSGGGQKDVMAADGGCGFSGRKDGSLSVDSGESLRTLFSDPLTGALMDDAMVLPCGHSFGGGGIQHVDRMKACPTCSQSVPEGSILPNLSLRAAIQAFQREEDLHFHRSSKRRRDRFDQERGNCPDLNPMDTARGRGVQFPFAVTDRVIIKGNKRTPERFVGREAIVTTQCLNGWYVVKTLDNAESVKLQYRSLAKVPDDSYSKAMSCKTNPNWL